MHSHKLICLRSEDSRAWDAHVAAYVAEFRPQSKPEHDLVFDLAATQWRMCRALRMGDMLERSTALSRYQFHLQKSYDLALANLLAIQARRGPPDRSPATRIGLAASNRRLAA